MPPARPSWWTEEASCGGRAGGSIVGTKSDYVMPPRTKNLDCVIGRPLCLMSVRHSGNPGHDAPEQNGDLPLQSLSSTVMTMSGAVKRTRFIL